MKKKLFANALIIIMTVIFLSGTVNIYSAGAVNVEIDQNIYNLYIDMWIDNTYNDAYGKFKTSRSADYTAACTLYLASEDAHDPFVNALKKTNISYNDDFIAPFIPELIHEDDEGKETKVKDTLDIYIPLPDDAQEHPEDCNFFQVTGSNAKLVNSTLSKDGSDIYYVHCEFVPSGVYGFVYNDPDSYEEEDEDSEDEDSFEDPVQGDDIEYIAPTLTPTPAPTATEAPIMPENATPSPTYGITPTAIPTVIEAPTPSITPTPTITPAQVTVQPTTAPTGKTDTTETPKATKAPVSTDTENLSNTKVTSIPKTGDDSNPEAAKAVAGVSAILFLGFSSYYIYLKRKQ